VRIVLDDLTGPEVRAMVSDHLADMRATSPPESVHALSIAQIHADAVTFWSVWDGEHLAGCGGLKALPGCEGELKSMRTAARYRGRGVGTFMLAHLIEESRTRGYQRINLETGSQDFFAPARRLYARHGFVECPPFGEYMADPNSVFMCRDLT